MPTIHLYAHPDIITLVIATLGFVLLKTLIELIP